MRNKILFAIAFVGMMAAGCIPRTKMGIAYAVHGPSSKLLEDRIDPNQIDAAWVTSAQLWGGGSIEDVIIIFWDKPIQWGQERYLGATWGTEINVYVKPGDESCLFLSKNGGGALVHEMGHALLFIRGNTVADPTHTDARWHQSEANRAMLEVTFCGAPK